MPLRVHGHYSRAEIEAAFGVLSDDAPWIHREGVIWHESSLRDLLFVTLKKSEALLVSRPGDLGAKSLELLQVDRNSIAKLIGDAVPPLFGMITALAFA